MNDALQHVKPDLAAVLAEYDVVVEDIQRHNAISFWVDNKRVHLLFSRVSASQAADLRQKLIELGARRKVSDQPPDPVVPDPPSQPELDQPAPEISDQPEMPTPGESESKVSSDEPLPEEPQPEPEEPLSAAIARAFEHNAMTYQSSQVIGIDINEPMVLKPGYVLVIPLNRPNALTTMRKEQFRILFPEMMPDHPPRVTPQVRNEPQPRDDSVNEDEWEVPVRPTRKPKPAAAPRPDTMNTMILYYLTQLKNGARAQAIAVALNFSTNSVEDRLGYMQDLGEVSVNDEIWTIQTTTPAPIVPISQVDQEQVDQERRVPAQLGRILYAMVYAEQTTGKTDLTPALVTGYLSDRDKKQYAARLIGAVKKGWVTRGLALPASRGWHYRLTNKAREIVKGLGTAPYEGDPPPPWFKFLS